MGHCFFGGHTSKMKRREFLLRTGLPLLAMPGIEGTTNLLVAPNWTSKQDEQMISGYGTGAYADVAQSNEASRAATMIVGSSTSSGPNDYTCDGTDDQIEIQKAVDAITTIGGRVLLSEGTFNLSATIALPSNVSLCGQGYSTYLNFIPEGNAIEVIGTPESRKNNVTIEKIRLVGPNAPPTTQVVGSGILFDYVDDCSVHDCDVSGFGASGDEGNIHISHCTAVHIMGNRLHLGVNGGITGTAVGIGTGASGGPDADRCVFHGNTCYGNRDDGLHGQLSAHMIFSNNICYSNGESGIDLLGDTGDTVIGNICYDNGHAGIEVGNTASIVLPDAGHTILGNTCHGNKQSGIQFLGEADDCTITGNTCASNARDGIQIAGTQERSNKRLVVSSNSIYSNSRDGIRLVNNAHENLIASNSIYENSGRGIYLVADLTVPDRNVVVNNLVSSNKSSQVVYSTASNTIVRDNYGYITDSSGTATIESCCTTITVEHGLDITPELKDILVTPTNNLGSAVKYWISKPTATHFTINVDADPGDTTATFSWKVIVQ